MTRNIRSGKGSDLPRLPTLSLVASSDFLSSVQDLPQFTEIGEGLPCLSSDFLNHSYEPAGIVFLTSVNTNDVAVQGATSIREVMYQAEGDR